MVVVVLFLASVRSFVATTAARYKGQRRLLLHTNETKSTQPITRTGACTQAPDSSGLCVSPKSTLPFVSPAICERFSVTGGVPQQQLKTPLYLLGGTSRGTSPRTKLKKKTDVHHAAGNQQPKRALTRREHESAYVTSESCTMT